MWSGGSIRALSSSGPARPYIAVSKYHGDVGFSAARRLSGGNLELEPIRYAATFIAGLPRDFAVGQTLFAQSAELFEYLPARLPMCETGAPGMCGSVNNCVLRQDGPARGMCRRAHLFVDCRLPSEGSGSDETDRLPAGPAVRLGRPAHKGRAVPADDLDGRMVTQPLGRTLDAAIVQYVDNRATLEINHDGPIVCRTPPTPYASAEARRRPPCERMAR